MSRSDLAKPSQIPKLPAKLRRKLEQAVYAWTDDLEHHTQRLYRRSLACFAEWLHEQGVLDPLPEKRDERVEVAGNYLLALKAADANAVVSAYLEDRLYPSDRGAPRYTRSTVETRRAALRWAVRHARRLGIVVWELDAPMPKVRKTRDGRLREKTSNRLAYVPTRDEAKAMIDAAKKDPDPRAWFIVSATLREGWREHEIRQLDLDDVDLKKHTVTMVRKKREEPEAYPLTKGTHTALAHCLKARGKHSGPLLQGGRHGVLKGSRIGTTIPWEIVRRVAKESDLEGVSPHMCRHRAVTDIVTICTKNGVPEEILLKLTGHSSRKAIEPYFEASKTSKNVRDVLEAAAMLDDEEEEEDD